jgi:sarcosine oxidase/L-pipecolate oxidase
MSKSEDGSWSRPLIFKAISDDSGRYYQGGGFPITKEGRLKFGFRGRKVRVKSVMRITHTHCLIYSSRAFVTIPQSRICKSCQNLTPSKRSRLTIRTIHFSRISTPRTRYSDEPINTVPLYGLQLMKEVISQAFPELAEIGLTDSRVC